MKDRQLGCAAYSYERGIDMTEVVGWRKKGAAGTRRVGRTATGERAEA